MNGDFSSDNRGDRNLDNYLFSYVCVDFVCVFMSVCTCKLVTIKTCVYMHACVNRSVVTTFLNCPSRYIFETGFFTEVEVHQFD